MNDILFPFLAAASGGAGVGYTGPLRMVVHTTETLADPLVWVPNWPSPSQVVADPKRRTVYQCIGLRTAAKSLFNAAGGVQTNFEGAIQVEINWRAPDGSPARPDLEESDYRWLAAEVFAPIARWAASEGTPINHGKVAPTGTIPGSATDYAPQRMSFDEWERFDGWCGHRNVPENDHWDAGTLDLDRLARYTAEVLVGVAPPETGQPSTPTIPEENMRFTAFRIPNGLIYVEDLDANERRDLMSLMPDGTTPKAAVQALGELVAAGLVKGGANTPYTNLGWDANWALDQLDNRVAKAS